MKRYNLLHPLALAYFSRSLYQDVAQHWHGVGFLYVLLLLALTWLPMMYKAQHAINHFATQEAPKLIQQIPDIEITNGQVSTDAAMPYIIRDPDSGQAFAIIDTTGQVTSLKQSQARILLTKTKLYTRRDGQGIREYDLAHTKDMRITQTELNGYLAKIKAYAVWAIYPIALLVSFIYRVIQLLLYAAIGTLIFNKMLKTKLDYQTILRLAAIAITPAVVLDTILSFYGIHFTFQLTLYFLLAMVYLYFAISVSRDGLNEAIRKTVEK